MGLVSSGVCKNRAPGARPVTWATLERMIDERPEADRITVAEQHGTAMHHARWRELMAAEHGAALAALRELAAGRADLLAEVAGILEGASEGELNEVTVTPLPCQAADFPRFTFLPTSPDGCGYQPIMPIWCPSCCHCCSCASPDCRCASMVRASARACGLAPEPSSCWHRATSAL
jgi:hypothetical protein